MYRGRGVGGLRANPSNVTWAEAVKAQSVQSAVCMGRMVPRSTDSAHGRYRTLLSAGSASLSLEITNPLAIIKGRIAQRQNSVKHRHHLLKTRLSR